MFFLDPRTKSLSLNKTKKETQKYYEGGAHFKYMDLYQSLVDLINDYPRSNLGTNFFPQHEEVLTSENLGKDSVDKDITKSFKFLPKINPRFQLKLRNKQPICLRNFRGNKNLNNANFATTINLVKFKQNLMLSPTKTKAIEKTPAKLKKSMANISNQTLNLNSNNSNSKVVSPEKRPRLTKVNFRSFSDQCDTNTNFSSTFTNLSNWWNSNKGRGHCSTDKKLKTARKVFNFSTKQIRPEGTMLTNRPRPYIKIL